MNRAVSIVAFTVVVSTLVAFTIKNAGGQEKKPMIPMAGPRYVYSGMLNGADSNMIEDFRQAGLHRDSSRISAMVSALKSPPHIGYTYTTIHALAQLGAMEALPTIEACAQDSDNRQDETRGDLCNFSKAARARLLAENEARPITDSKTASAAKIHRFYKELGLTPNQLNEALDAYYHPPQTVANSQGTPEWVSLPSDTAPVHPVGVYAVRELADMMYHGDFKELAALPEVSQINFSGDYPSALKVRLAALPPSERLNTMLQELSQKKVLTHWENYEIQLASNEGLAASDAVATLLKTMEANPSQYADVGFMALVRVMSGTGDQTKAALVRHLLENKLIYTGNLPIADLTNGVKRAREPAY